MYDLSKWTGKTPITLLHELCQKKKWLKPQYYTVSLGGTHTLLVYLLCIGAAS